MYIAIKENEKHHIDSVLNIEVPKNTLGIISLSPVKVDGNISFLNALINFDLNIKTTVIINDDNNHRENTYDLNFKIAEIDENYEKNIYIDGKTLDLNAKIWENIVVEVFSISMHYDSDVTSGKNWQLQQEDNNKIDERLKPLLSLLDTNEEV